MRVDPKVEYLYHLSPYNSMGNNPISYADPEGDIPDVLKYMIGVSFGALAWEPTYNYVNGTATLGQAAGQYGMNVVGFVTSGGPLNYAVGYASSKLLPSYSIDLGGGFGFSISPSVVAGSNGLGIGFNSSISYTSKNFHAGLSVGSSYYMNAPSTGNAGFETRYSGGGGFTLNNNIGLSYYHSKFVSGETSQRVGNVVASYLAYEITAWG